MIPSLHFVSSFVLALGAVLSHVAPALAHINLLSPPPRAPGRPDTNLGRGPCGQRQNSRNEETVSVFQPGQSIDVTWEVYVQHVSYFRISFDPEGDDSFSSRPSMPRDPSADDPTALPPGDGEIILGYVRDPSGDIDRVEQRVTLPDVECERCTLQVIQFTYGLPIRDATYHQCADLVLSAAAPAGDGDAGPPGDADSPPASAGEQTASAGCALGPPRRGHDRLVALVASALGLAALARTAQRRSAERRRAGPHLARLRLEFAPRGAKGQAVAEPGSVLR